MWDHNVDFWISTKDPPLDAWNYSRWLSTDAYRTTRSHTVGWSISARRRYQLLFKNAWNLRFLFLAVYLALCLHEFKDMQVNQVNIRKNNQRDISKSKRSWTAVNHFPVRSNSQSPSVFDVNIVSPYRSQVAVHDSADDWAQSTILAPSAPQTIGPNTITPTWKR